MRRRLTLAMVALVAGALLVSGVGTLALVQRAARQEVREELLDQVTALAASLDFRRPQILRNITRSLRLDGYAIVRTTPTGDIVGLPDGVPAAFVEAVTSSPVGANPRAGDDGDLVYAALRLDAPRNQSVSVVLTRRVPSVTRGARFFLLSGAAALLAAVVVADRLSRRITAPVGRAEAATRKIAAGDLEARVDLDDDLDPEVASLSRSINTLAGNLDRARRLERQFLMSVSHDLRTPLTSIRGFAEAIADGTAPDHERAAAVIAAESRRLERLVGDLLELAKLDARRFSLDVRSVDAGEVVADTAAAFEQTAEQVGVSLDVDLPVGGPVMVAADPDRLAQVVANLVENALKFAASHVTVVLTTGAEDVVVAVDDDGLGIPDEDLARVFERMYQSARTATRQVGSGLGLAIVAELVSAMGGTVRAESPPDSGGARIVVRLPRA